ncbi:hypothetical protein OF83DRAFT_1064093 [Amylostereum chailletii]|nr:hypothetical protein OF83DRAFT_1064093 [Amylostereum chailletii]
MPELEAVNNDQDDDDKTDEARCAYNEEEIAAIAAKVAAQLKVSPHEQCAARSVLKKVSKLATRIHFFPTLHSALLTLCVKHRTTERIILHPVATQWNSVSIMIGSALEICAPINALITQDKYKLQACVLKDSEWAMLMQLYLILHISLSPPFAHMEQMGKPLLFQVISAIDTLTSGLENTASDAVLNIVIRAAALSGAKILNKILNKYYAKTDKLIMYHMTMSTSFLFNALLMCSLSTL